MDSWGKDVVKLILQFLAGNPNCFIFRQVCKEWHQLVSATQFQLHEIIKYNGKNKHLTILAASFTS